MIPLLPFAPFINHLLAPEPWARDKLRLHAGKVAVIDAELLTLRLKVSADGMVEAASADSPPDVKITVKVSDLPLIAQNRERAFSYVKVDGDADFANTISQLSQTLRWEAEEDLSRLFGDIAAVRMVATARNVVQTVKDSHQKLQENLAEYFLEENPMLVRPAAVTALGSDVNKIRDDVERLSKRIEKMERLR